jgi:Leucine-rich repeat (LRR) protein
LDLPVLEYLDLKVNRIQTLPEDLSRLTRLKVIAIQSNDVSKIPLCVGQMTSLVHFNARRNPITFPPKDKWTLPHLEATMETSDKIQADMIMMKETQNLLRALQEYAEEADGAKPGLRESKSSELVDGEGDFR